MVVEKEVGEKEVVEKVAWGLAVKEWVVSVV